MGSDAGIMLLNTLVGSTMQWGVGRGLLPVAPNDTFKGPILH